MARKPAQSTKATGILTPGEHLRVALNRLGLDQVAVSKITGVSRQSINNVINDRQSISRAMAGKLGRLTGHSSDYWLRDSFARNSKQDQSNARPFGGGLLANHQITRAVKDGIIGINPFIFENVRAASIDLTLGAVVTAADGQKTNISGGKCFSLIPGRAVSVSTRERIELPLDYVGRVSTTRALGAKGVLVSAGFQLEPNFKGRIEIYLFNAGASPFRLYGEDPIVTLEIHQLAAAAIADPIAKD